MGHLTDRIRDMFGANGRRRYVLALQHLRRNLTAGTAVRHIDDTGLIREGTVLTVRAYDDGTLEGLFMADDRSVMRWVPTRELFPRSATSS
jgi:hypothetical protein